MSLFHKLSWLHPCEVKPARCGSFDFCYIGSLRTCGELPSWWGSLRLRFSRVLFCCCGGADSVFPGGLLFLHLFSHLCETVTLWANYVVGALSVRWEPGGAKSLWSSVEVTQVQELAGKCSWVLRFFNVEEFEYFLHLVCFQWNYFRGF